MSATLLVRGGLVVTMDAARRILETNVLVEGRIAECPSDRVEADVVVDASGGLVIPGLIQTHVHLCQTLFRGMADDMDVIDWLRLRIWPFEQAHDERSIYDSARLAIAEMLLGERPRRSPSRPSGTRRRRSGPSSRRGSGPCRARP